MTNKLSCNEIKVFFQNKARNPCASRACVFNECTHEFMVELRSSEYQTLTVKATHTKKKYDLIYNIF